MIQMKVLVNHPYLGQKGGAEQVFFQVIRALIDIREEVAVLSDQKTLNELENTGVALVPYNGKGFRLRRFQVYQKFLRHELKKRHLKRRIGTVDLEIMTQDVMFLVGVGRKQVAYVHYPENLWRLENARVRSEWVWRFLYYPVLRSFRKKVANIDAFFCNSGYTKKAIHDRWGREAKVVYPPVDVENFCPAPKEDFVVSVGRFVKTKNYEFVVDVARRMPESKFIIIGRKQNFEPYYEKIQKIKPANVELLTNAPLDIVSSTLGRAKVYLHAMVGEHFGISVVEAMAAGCIPVVHDSGGMKEAIGEFGYLYKDTNECVYAVRKALNDRVEPADIAKHANTFSSDNFRRAFVEALRLEGFL